VWEEKNWDQVEAEHEIPHALGGSDKPPNVKPCCSGKCEALQPQPTSHSTASSQRSSKGYTGHRDKTKADVKRIAKSNAVVAKHSHFKRSKNPMLCSKRSGWAKKYDRATGRWKAVRRDK
jgi:hypothetical protein